MMRSNEEVKSDLVALTRDLILIPSTEGRPKEVKRCFEFLLHHLEGLDGVRIERYESNGHLSMVALPESASHPEVLLCGHLDVIEHPQEDCYHSSVQDGRIYGPGAGDMKGQDAILVELFRSLQSSHPGLSLGLALTSDEEIGGADGMRFLCEDMGLRCRSAIIPDGGSLRDITTEEKGVLHAKIRRKGHEAHGARPWLGENAVELLIESLVALKQHFNQFWPAEPIEEQVNHWFPTCSVTVLRTPNTTPNRIPGESEAIVDIRFPPPHTVASMREEIAQILGPACELQPLMMAEPTQLAPDPAFSRITADLTGQEVRYVRASGGSDSRFLRRYDIPVNLSRPLVGNLHALDEWIDIDSMVTYYRICERYILEKAT